MIIIGEKLNGSIPSCGRAIAERDENYIRDTAKKQADAGSTFIDVCASVNENELEILKWMIDLVQEVTDIPISVDSPSAQVCVDALKYCNRPGLLNSVSAEGNKIETIFSAIADTEWDVMALLCDDEGIPKTAAKRIEVFEHLMAKAKEYGIATSRIHIDPLVEMLCTSENGIETVVEVMTYIKQHYPDVHISGAVSNISFNLPVRKLINQAFVVLAINAGMDSAVLDPTNRDLIGTIYATEALLGKDFFSMEYINAYRENRFGPLPKA